MSELKVYHCNEWHNEYTEFYMKHEADKVIDDLIEKNKQLARKDRIMASETIKEVFKEINHQKYKRCLNMADLCFREYQTYCAFIDRGEDYSDKMNFYEKWHKRWLELAEKFKGA